MKAEHKKKFSLFETTDRTQVNIDTYYNFFLCVIRKHTCKSSVNRNKEYYRNEEKENKKYINVSSKLRQT